MRNFITQLHIIAAIIGLLCACYSNILAQERRTQWLFRDGDLIWCATPSGLVRYDITTEVWENIVISGIIEPEPIHEIVTDNGELWLLTSTAVIQSDPSRTQWISYGYDDGIPPGTPTQLTFHDDYVYLATTAGIARFDRTIEEWESLLIDTTIFNQSSCVAQTTDYIWFSSQSGLHRFDPAVEALTTVSNEFGLLQNHHYWLLEQPDELWAIGQSGVDVYQPQSRSWFGFTPTLDPQNPDVLDIESDGDVLWILTPQGIQWWDWEEHSERPFPRANRLMGRQVFDIDVAGSQVVFSSENDVVIMDRTSTGKEWTYIDQSRGLPAMKYNRVEKVDNLLLLQHNSGILVYDVDLGEVLAEYKFRQVAIIKKERAKFGIASTEQGLETRAWDETLCYFKGSSTVFGTRLPHQEWDWRQRTNMSAIRSFGNDRTLTLSYDNTDLDRIRWGGVYRGNRNDNVRRIEGGNRVPMDFGGSRLLGETSVKGGSARLEAGLRSTVRGWRRATLDGWGGIQQEASAHEVFPGEGDVLYYLENTNLVIGSARVWIDGEELQSGEFVLDHSSGTFSFLFPGRDLVDENSLIEVRYRYNLEDDTGATMGAVGLGGAAGDYLRGGAVFHQTEDSLQTGQVSAEAYISLPNGEFHVLPEVAIQADSNEETSQAGFVDFRGRVSTVKVEGSWIGLDAAFQTLAVENSQFGKLRERGQVETLWEPKSWIGLGGHASRELAMTGREDQFGGSLTLSPPGYPMVFVSARRTDAWADTTNRHRDFLNGGIRFQLGKRTLAPVGFTQADFDLQSRWAGVQWYDPDGIDPSLERKTKQVWFRGRLASGTRFSVRPEYFWRRKDSDVGGANDWQPEEKRNRLLTTIYLVDLPVGLTTTARLEGELEQSEYFAGSDSWDAYLTRNGEVSVEAIPGVWWRELNPFTLGVSATIDRQDSLTDLADDVNWGDVLDAADKSRWELQITTLRNEITYRPDPRWLITQVLTTSETQDFLQERSSSSTVEWSPRGSTRWTARYQWTQQEYDDPTNTDYTIHRPSVEWYQRWGGSWFTRSTLSGELYDHETAGYREGSWRNYVSAVWREVPRLGRLECREEVTVSAREYDVTGDVTRTISNNIRGDWKPFREMFFRAEWLVTYQVDEDDSEVTHRVEIRMGVRL